MVDSEAASRSHKSWLLALAAVALCGPWPAWSPASLPLLLVCTGLYVLARPSGHARGAWLAVAVALIFAVWPTGGGDDRSRMENRLDRHCEQMLGTGEDLATDPTLLRLLGAAGEVVDPAAVFAALDRRAGGAPGRTIYLVDDRGQIVAWGPRSRLMFGPWASGNGELRGHPAVPTCGSEIHCW